MEYLLMLFLFVSFGSFVSGIVSAIRSARNGTTLENNRPYVYFLIAFLLAMIIHIIAIVFK